MMMEYFWDTIASIEKTGMGPQEDRQQDPIEFNLWSVQTKVKYNGEVMSAARALNLAADQYEDFIKRLKEMGQKHNLPRLTDDLGPEETLMGRLPPKIPQM